MISVFVSYAHADEELRRQLDVHPASLKRQGIIDVWHDRRITAGEDFAHAIDEALIRANIVLLLVSPDFASDYCYDVEMHTALEREARGEAVVIPVILRDCEWHGLQFGRLRATPTDGKPIRLFTDLDSAFLEVVRDIKAAALKLRAPEPPRQSSAATPPRARADMVHTPRSGNLRVHPRFSDFDRERFATETFDYIARYFENSLDELMRRNAGVRFQFRRVDATAFEAALYDERGRERSRAGVWIAGGRGAVGRHWILGCRRRRPQQLERESVGGRRRHFAWHPGDGHAAFRCSERKEAADAGRRGRVSVERVH